VICLIVASSSTNIKCDYESHEYYVVGSVYHCDINSNPNIITKESAESSEIIGEHLSSKSNDDVTGIGAYKETIYYFPKAFRVFKNLKAIQIAYCGLKEIHQSDLLTFSNLAYFFVYGNEIKVIEKGLFDYNPDLQVVGFQETAIVHIDPNVFDHLTKLTHFWLDEVPCVDMDVPNSEKLQEAIQVVKSNCSNSEYL
jgi:hypothetical protein